MRKLVRRATTFAVVCVMMAAAVPLLSAGEARAAGNSIALTTFRDIIVAPTSGDVYISGDDSVYRFDPSGIYIQTIPNVYGAAGMDISGTSLWVAETTAAKIAEIDLTTQSKVREIPAGVPVTGRSLAVIGGMVLFASGAQLEQLDPATSTVTARGSVIDGEFERVGAATTTLLTYGLGNTYVRKVNIATNPATVTGTGDGGGNLRQIAVNPTTHKYVYASGAPYYFGEVSIATMGATGLQYAGTNYPSAIAYSPGFGGLFAGGTQSSNTMFVSKAGNPTSVATMRLPGEQVDRGMAMSIDGTKIYAVYQNGYAMTTPTKYLATLSPLPTATVVLPGQVVADVPTQVTVTGTNLGGVSNATVAGLTATVTVQSPTQVTVTMPVGVAPGTRTITLTTPLGTASLPVDVIANTGATLRGTVKVGSAPRAGIGLTLSGGGLASPATTSSAADGTYRFANLPYGTYTLTARDPNGTFPDQMVTGLTVVPNNTFTQDILLTTTQTGTGAVLASTPLSGPPRDMVVDRTTNRAFVSVGDEVDAFNASGQLLARFAGLYTADGLAINGTDLYVNQRTAGRISRINTATLALTGSWPTTHPTTGGLAFAGGRLWYTNGNDQWVGISSLDPVTGTVVESGGSWYVPRFRPVAGNSNLFFAYEQGISSVAGYIINGSAPTLSVMSSAWGAGTASAASATLNKVWNPAGKEFQLSTMTATGVQYPVGASGYSPVAFSPARSGVLGFGTTIARAGTPAATHTLPEAPVVKAFDGGANRLFYATNTSLVVWDLAPHLIAISPAPVYTDATTIQLSGTGLATTSAVMLDGASVPFSVVDTDRLSVTVGLTAGPHAFTVNTAWGTSNSLAFAVTVRPPPPTVTSLAPSTRPTAGGTVTITGTNFTGTTAVSFGGVPVSFTVVNDTTINVVVPAHIAATVNVIVSTANGSNASSPSFSWVAPPPVVTSLSPVGGGAAGGNMVTITGSGFLFATSVTFGSTPASFSVLNDTTINATAPAHALGTVSVSVTTAGGTSPSAAGSQYTYSPPRPAVFSLSPSQGATSGGYQVLISGTNLTGATNVTFGVTPAASFLVLNDSSIVAVAPPGIAGTASVFVTNALGTSLDSIGGRFLYVSDASTFRGLTPSRILDSRIAPGLWGGPLAAGSPRPLTVTGVGGVPANAAAVVLNVTVTGSDSGSFVTAYPAGTAVPNASNINFGPGQTIANLATVRVGAGGAVMFSTAVGSTHVVVDVVGYYQDGAGELFNGVIPTRTIDTRIDLGVAGALGAGDANTKSVQISGRASVPPNASSVVVNLTVTQGSENSFLQVWPTGSARPTGSNLNFAAGQTTSNLAVVKLGSGGQISLFNAVGVTDVVADVVGYFDPTGGSVFHPLDRPVRLLDDRINVGLSGPWGPNQSRTLGVTGPAIPAGSSAVVLNATVTAATTGSFITMYPTGQAVPTSSNINFAPGETVANLAMLKLSAGGAIDIYNRAGTVDIIGDAVGYFSIT